MHSSFYSLGVLCVLYSGIKIVTSQSETESESCGMLSPQKSVKITCESSPGVIVACDESKAGGIAKLSWKSSLLPKGEKTSNSPLLCSATGQWKKKKLKSGSDYFTLPGFGAYKVHQKQISIDAANATCSLEGARLLIPDSKAELNAVIQNLQEMGLEDEKDIKTWIPIGVRASYGRFKTELGAVFPTSARLTWAPNEPTLVEAEQCVIVEIPAIISYDTYCSSSPQKYFICERPLN